MDDIKEILGEELFKKVTEKLGDKELMLDDGKAIPYSRFQEVNEKKKSLETQLESQKETYEKQLSEVNKQLTEFSELPKVTQDQKDKIKALQESNAQLKAEYEASTQKLKRDSMVEMALLKAEAKNTKAVKALLDLEKISVDGENLVGFSDQIEAIKKNNDYMFGNIERVGGTPAAGGTPEPTTEVSKLQKQYKEVVEKHGMANIQAIGLKNRIHELTHKGN